MLRVLRDTPESDLCSALNWWCEPAMAPKINATEKPPDRDEIQRIIAGQIKSALENLPKPKEPAWYVHPWSISFGSVVATAVVTVLIANWQFGRAHSRDDLKRDIAQEVSTQLTPIRTSLEARLDKSDAALDNKLEAMRTELEQQGKDIARIKGADGIANGQGPRSLDRFRELTPSAFSTSLASLQATLGKPFITDESTIQVIAQKLHATDERSSDYWPTVLTFIQVISASMFRSYVPPPSQPLTQLSDVHAASGRSFFRGAHIVLDGVELGPSVFENCRIRFTAKQNRISDATFINCVFEFPDIPQTTPAMKKIGLELLASGVKKAIVSAS